MSENILSSDIEPWRNWSNLITDSMDFEHGNGSRKNFEVNGSDVDLNTQGNDSVPSSSSPSSSDSSQDFVLDINVVNDKFGKFKQDDPEPQGPIWIPEVAGQAPQSSNIFMMEQPKGYDPKRIPSAIFASKPATPVDWSVASNESLFSIQLGNGSFSRDHVLMMYKSGELSRLEESITLAKHYDSSKLSELPVHVQSNLPVVTEVEHMDRTEDDLEDRKSEDDLEKDSEEIDVSSYPQKVVIVDIGDDHSQDKMPFAEDVRMSTRSDESSNSTKSFAFPLLVGGVGRNSSVNINVDKEDNEHKPSTSLPQKQPSKRSEEPMQPQSLEATAKSAACSCFSWFRCFSRCC